MNLESTKQRDQQETAPAKDAKQGDRQVTPTAVEEPTGKDVQETRADSPSPTYSTGTSATEQAKEDKKGPT